MINQPHLWNLRRIFGSQTVGCVGRPSRPEVGIAAQVTPAQSSRWTFHGQGDIHCRPADLPTCRPAESDHQRYRPSYSHPAIAEAFSRHSTPMARDSPNAAPQDTPNPPESRCILRRIIRCHRFESSCLRHLPSPMKTERNQITLNDQVLSQ